MKYVSLIFYDFSLSDFTYVCYNKEGIKNPQLYKYKQSKDFGCSSMSKMFIV